MRGGAAIPPHRAAGISTSAAAPAASILAAALLVFGLPAAANAQRVAGPDSPTEQASDPSPAVAGVLSLATTAVPMVAGSVLDDGVGLGLVGAGLLFGPLSGYAYGNAMDRGLKGLAFRSAVAAGGTIAIFAICQAGDCNPFRDNPTDEDLSTATLGVVIVGGLVLVGSAAIDVIAAPDHVTRANRERAEAGCEEASGGSGPQFSVYPLLSPVEPAAGIGLAASLRF